MGYFMVYNGSSWEKAYFLSDRHTVCWIGIFTFNGILFLAYCFFYYSLIVYLMVHHWLIWGLIV